MAAPSVIVRTVPAGYFMENGFQALIAMQNVPGIAFKEISLKPPGVDGGDPIPTTTQFNTSWHTQAPRSLKKLTSSTSKAAYDPDLYTTLFAQINIRQSITYHFPTGDAISFWGYLKSMEPDPLEEGKRPEVEIMFVPTNEDPTTLTEAAPVYTSASGT